MEQSILLFSALSGASPRVYWHLSQAFGDIQSALQQPPPKLAQWLSPSCQAILADYQARRNLSPLGQKLEQIRQLCAEQGISLVDHLSPLYPKPLLEIPQAPPLLYVKGNAQSLLLPQLAIVGSRNPTPGGLQNAMSFARHLALGGLAITSGLALGVDQQAHLGALEAEGATLAVMATGIDQVYPRAHRRLAESIVANGGALITEFPPGTQPLAAYFPQRNRIISGLAAGVLVVEAAIKSGSLITARFALSHNREVFAIPGSIHNPLSRGCHALIKEGAVLVETAQDIVEHLQGFLALKWQEVDTPQQPLTSVQKQVLAQLGFDLTHLDDLCERVKLPLPELLASLTELELAGRVGQFGGCYQRLS